jgi:hypothetical protein
MSKCDLDPGVGVCLLRMTHRLIITNICAKLFQIPLINDKVTDRTRKCDGQTDDRWREPISISPFFLRKGGGQKIGNELGGGQKIGNELTTGCVDHGTRVQQKGDE